MMPIDDSSFYETRPVHDIRTGQVLPVTLRRSHWRAVKDWSNGTGGCLEAALADLQSDIAAAWAGLGTMTLPLRQRILCILLQATSCTVSRSYGAANDNQLYGEALFDWVDDFNPRVPRFALRLPEIVSAHPRMPVARPFVIPRND